MGRDVKSPGSMAGALRWLSFAPHRHRVMEGLHRRFAEAPASLMRPLFIVLADPQIQVGLQLVD
jgi:hypothetical protein